MDPIPDIVSALQSGRQRAAEQLAWQALQQAPDSPDLLLLHALSLHQQGRLAEALVDYQRLTVLLPDNPLHWGNYAKVLREAGELDAAARACDAALALDAADAELWISRGLIQLQARAFVEAREALLTAVTLAPDSAQAHIYAARACAICRDDRADQLIQHWHDWLPLEHALQLELADLKMVMGDANTAHELLEDLRAQGDHSVPVQLLLATVYERINRPDAAAGLLHSLEAQGSPLPEQQREIDHLLAALALRAGDHARAMDLLEGTGPRHGHDYAHYFALAEACDKARDAAGALAALATAHQLQVQELQQVVPFRLRPDAPVMPASVGRVTPDDFARWSVLKAPAAEHSPIFIVGFPRSGTTLLEQMLDAHPALQSMDEQPFFNTLGSELEDYGFSVPADLHKLDQYACDELRKGYLKLVSSRISRHWEACLVDKNPLNMQWLPLIHRLFPRARFILALRHPCDVLVSNYMQNFRTAVLASACATPERLAQAYVASMQSWLYHVEVFHPEVLVSRYEDLVADPAAQAQRIGDFLGLADASPLLDFDRHARAKGYIATPSYTQVIEPVNRKGLNRWHRYRDALEPALPILQPMLEHWGYGVE